jgi:hypothetical protein
MITVPDFKKEVFAWAEEIGVTPKEIHVRPMTRKWGSCSSKGRLTFAYEFLNKSPEERAQVIVHELLHLRYKSHNNYLNCSGRRICGNRGFASRTLPSDLSPPFISLVLETGDLIKNPGFVGVRFWSQRSRTRHPA